MPSLYFSELREQVWSVVRSECNSFRAMDCNAQFSEIFTLNFLKDLYGPQKSSLVSTFTAFALCNSCNNYVSSNSDIFVHYVTAMDLIRHSLQGNDWYKLVLRNNEILTVSCNACRQQCNAGTLEICLSDILLIEISPSAMNAVRLKQTIIINDIKYNIRGMVRNSGAHFTCAVFKSQVWQYYDDMSENVIQYTSLQNLLHSHVYGWFFLIYIKDSSEQGQVRNNLCYGNSDQQQSHDITSDNKVWQFEHDHAKSCEFNVLNVTGKKRTDKYEANLNINLTKSKEGFYFNEDKKTKRTQHQN